MKWNVVRTFSLLAVLIVWSQSAFSQGMQSSWYGEVGAGVAFQSETDLSQFGVPFSIDYDTGFIISGSLGTQLGQLEGLRVEGEILYSQNDFDTISIGGVGSAPFDGDASAFAGMINALFDFDTGTMWRPFIGAGVGYANVSVDGSVIGIPLVDDDDSGFAYQFKAGLAYQFDEKTDFLISYRYFATEDLDFNDSVGDPFSADGVENHSVQVGVRFRF